MNASMPTLSLAIPTIPIAAIVPSPSNPRKRFDEAYLVELGESIKTHGLIQPITVRPLPLDHLFEYNRKHPDADPLAHPTFEIVVGECRWRAAKLAGLSEIPAFWRELDDKQVLEIQVIENLQRRDVHPIEEADGYRMLIARHQYRVEDIALKIGKSRSYVFGRMKLADLGDKGRDLFFDGSIDASVALLIARLAESDQNKMLKELQRINNAGEPISYRDAKWRIRNGFTIDLMRATFPLDDASLLASAGSCTACPKRSGNAPEIYPDIESADVCTDTKCFDEKRLTRREQLLDNYREKHIPVYVDEDAKMIAPGGHVWSIDSSKWTDLTDHVPGDPEKRTYAELLGDRAPVSAVVEVGSGVHRELLELIEVTSLEAALEAAGWEKESQHRPEWQNNAARDLAYKVESEARIAAWDAEKKRRNALLNQIVERLDGTGNFPESKMNIIPVFIALALAQVRREHYHGDEVLSCLSNFGIITPDEYDQDEELEKACSIIETWPLGKVMALTAWGSVDFELDDCRNPSPALDAIARAVGLDAGCAVEPLSPSTAAQAEDSLRDEDETFPSPNAAQAGDPTDDENQEIERNEKPAAAGSAADSLAGQPTDGEENREERKTTPSVKYQHLQDARLTWSGKGRRPMWVKDHLAGGGSLDELEITA
jgi:ParB/RepB/Spo0J family partition protein